MKRFRLPLLSAIALVFPATLSAVDFSLPQVLRELLARGTENVYIVDVRTPEEFATGHLPQAVNVPVNTIPSAINLAWKHEAVALYCGTGIRSAKAAKALREIGFSAVYDLGGLQQYTVKVDAATIDIPLSAADASCRSDAVYAQVGPRKITGSQLMDRVDSSLRQLEQSRYEILKSGLDSLIGRALLELEAASRGISVDDLVKLEIIAKVRQPEESEVAKALAFAQESGGAPIDATMTDERETLRQELILMMTQEEGFRVRQAFIPTLKALLAAYPEQLRLFYRDFPLESHARALSASRAARAAAAQGKFWEFRDLLAAQPEPLSGDFLVPARELKLDESAFKTSMADPKIQALIDADLAAAAELGIDGVPVFFVNGHRIEGAQDQRVFKDAVDRELAERR